MVRDSRSFERKAVFSRKGKRRASALQGVKSAVFCRAVRLRKGWHASCLARAAFSTEVAPG